MPSTEKYRNYDQKIIWGSAGVLIAISGLVYHSWAAPFILAASIWAIVEGIADRRAYSAKIKAEFDKKANNQH